MNTVNLETKSNRMTLTLILTACKWLYSDLGSLSWDDVPKSKDYKLCFLQLHQINYLPWQFSLSAACHHDLGTSYYIGEHCGQPKNRWHHAKHRTQQWLMEVWQRTAGESKQCHDELQDSTEWYDFGKYTMTDSVTKPQSVARSQLKSPLHNDLIFKTHMVHGLVFI